MAAITLNFDPGNTKVEMDNLSKRVANLPSSIPFDQSAPWYDYHMEQHNKINRLTLINPSPGSTP